MLFTRVKLEGDLLRTQTSLDSKRFDRFEREIMKLLKYGYQLEKASGELDEHKPPYGHAGDVMFCQDRPGSQITDPLNLFIQPKQRFGMMQEQALVLVHGVSLILRYPRRRRPLPSISESAARDKAAPFTLQTNCRARNDVVESNWRASHRK